MIRDLSQSDKIKYSKKFIDNTRSFLFYWLTTPEGMFEDIDFYIATFWHEFTLKAKISGTICGLLVLPFIFLTFILILFIANICPNPPNEHPTAQIIGRGIIFLFLLFPFGLIRFPFSLYSYFAFKKKALIYLLEVGPEHD